MRRRLGWFSLLGVVGVAVTVLPHPAYGQARAAVSVQHEPGTEECPDAASLGERIAVIRGRVDTPHPHPYELVFSRRADAFSATIRSGPRGEHVRVLTGPGPTCAAVAQAAAVTLALLFDADAESPLETKPEPATPAPTPRKPTPVLTAQPVRVRPSSGRRVQSTLSLGASGLAFVLGPLAPAFDGALGMRIGRVRAEIGLLWSPTQSLALGPGHVDERLLTGVARTCLALVPGGRIEFGVCTGLFVGALQAQAVGFTSNQQRVRSWIAVPLELSLAELSRAVGWELSASALGALRHRDFEVEGLGVAYRAPRVGAMLTLRAVGLLTW